MGYRLKLEHTEDSLEEKYNKQKRKNKIQIIIILLLILGFFIYELKFSEKSIFNNGDKYEEYNPNYPIDEQKSIIEQQEKKETSNVVENITSNTVIDNINNNSNVSTEIIKVSSIKFNDLNPTIVLGDSKVLSVTVYPETAKDKTVTYKSSDESVATIDSNGKVTAKKIGTTNIVVTTNDGKRSANVKLTVVEKKISVVGITLQQVALSLKQGENATINYSIMPSDATNKDIEWTSDNTSVATVNSNGIVTGKSVGNATITAKTKDGGYKKTLIVSVYTLPTSISLTPTNSTINIGGTLAIVSTVYPTNAENKNLTWTSSNTSVATISSTGYITCNKKGDTTITATADGVSKSINFSVSQSPDDYTINISKNKLGCYLITEGKNNSLVPECVYNGQTIAEGSHTTQYYYDSLNINKRITRIKLIANYSRTIKLNGVSVVYDSSVD